MTEQELREKYPEIMAQAEARAKAAGNQEAVNAAVQAERNRICEIDSVACLYPEQMVHDAKYGENPCTAQELTYRAAQAAAQKGGQFLRDLEHDASASGAGDVPAATPTSDGEGSETVDKIQAQAKADMKAFQNNKEVC